MSLGHGQVLGDVVNADGPAPPGSAHPDWVPLGQQPIALTPVARSASGHQVGFMLRAVASEPAFALAMSV
jgi:hypothetical protein